MKASDGGTLSRNFAASGRDVKDLVSSYSCPEVIVRREQASDKQGKNLKTKEGMGEISRINCVIPVTGSQQSDLESLLLT